MVNLLEKIDVEVDMSYVCNPGIRKSKSYILSLRGLASEFKDSLGNVINMTMSK